MLGHVSLVILKRFVDTVSTEATLPNVAKALSTIILNILNYLFKRPPLYRGHSFLASTVEPGN